MKITDVKVTGVDIPLSTTFGGSRYSVSKRCTIVTQIETDSGIVSEVYNGDNRDHFLEVMRIIKEEIAPLLIGEDPTRIEYLWQKAFKLAEWNRDRKLVMEAIACVDTALWDILGKAAGLNVCRLLGGYRQEVPIVSIGGYYGDGRTLADLSREMEALRRDGIGGCKVKVGGLSPEEDARRVAAARQGGGDGFILAVDANRGWSVAEAIRFARLIEDQDIAWFEEPCHWHDDARFMAQVRAATSIPINAGQSEMTAWGIRRMIAEGAVDIVNFDASEAGGITEWKRIASMCFMEGIGLCHHEEAQVAMQMIAAVPNGICVECFGDVERDPVWHGMIANRPMPRDGMIAIPQGPGLGLELDWDMIERHRVTL